MGIEQAKQRFEHIPFAAFLGVKVVDISMRVRGLSDGKHAVHVHAVGLCAPCSMAGGHFDPGPSGNPCASFAARTSVRLQLC